MNKHLSKEYKFFDKLYVSAESLHFDVNFDLSHLINSWKKLDTKKFPMLKPLQKEVLKEWKNRPELHGKHKDNSKFQGHEDFIKMVLAFKYSLDDMHKKDSMMGIFVPVTLAPIWTTPSFQKLQMHGSFDPTEMIEQRNIALI